MKNTEQTTMTKRPKAQARDSPFSLVHHAICQSAPAVLLSGALEIWSNSLNGRSSSRIRHFNNFGALHVVRTLPPMQSEERERGLHLGIKTHPSFTYLGVPIQMILQAANVARISPAARRRRHTANTIQLIAIGLTIHIPNDEMADL